MENTVPNYRIIFKDILQKKYPNKLEEGLKILAKEQITAIDVIQINNFIFNKTYLKDSQKYRSYTKRDILQILDYQKKNKLNNTQLSKKFNLSRNTIAKWKTLFLV